MKYALGIPSEAALRQYGFPEEEIPEIVDFWGDLTPDYRKFIKVFPESGRFWKSSKKTVPDWA